MAEDEATRDRGGEPEEGKTEPPKRDGAGSLDDSIVNEATRAWFSTFFSSPAAHRSNAQAGYAVAAAVAAAIVGAGILASIDTSPWWLQVSALITLGLWLVAAWEFMRAIAVQPNFKGPAHEFGPTKLVEAAIQRTWKERRVIAQRSWRAQQVARLAGTATFITVILVMIPSQATPTTTTGVALTPSGTEHFAQLCKRAPDVVRGRLDPEDLSDEFIALMDVRCGKSAITLRLRRRDIAGLRSP